MCDSNNIAMTDYCHFLMIAAHITLQYDKLMVLFVVDVYIDVIKESEDYKKI